MSLAAGTKLGPYQILAPIGAGGMGEVYRARDTKLGRDVAIKVLPQILANDPERLARFEREAKVLASLNHPNIAHIYGIEERALVMELVEGETLKGPLPLDEALRIAAQICNALEAAHEKGITHRDLKPANIMVTPAGVVKVLDFGLAAVASPSAGDPGDAANSPTLTMSPTHAGMILGTAAYMSPEQARGKVVLYEMLTGQPLFHGETVSDILAAVLKEQLDLERVPVEVRRLLQRCLEIDPKRRLRDIGDAMELVAVGAAHVPPSTEPGPVPQRWPWIVATVFALAALALAFLHFRETKEQPRVTRTSLLPPEKRVFEVASLPAVSPDGRHLAFVASSSGDQLWVRDLDSLVARPLPGTDRAYNPFWSPDSRSVAFFAAGKLKKIEVAGGPALTLCDIPAPGRGGSWSNNDLIVFATNSGGILRVPAAGGSATPVTQVDHAAGETNHRFPWFLPDGRHFLYTSQNNAAEKIAVYAGDVDSKSGSTNRRRILTADSLAVYTPPGYLLFVRGSTLMAQPFDAGKLRNTGDAVPIAEQVDSFPGINGHYQFSASQNGVLAYMAGGKVSGARLTWIDRQGKVLSTVGEPGPFASLSMSPDGKRVVVRRVDGQDDLWLIEFDRGSSTRFTFDPAQDSEPLFSPDGAQIAWDSSRKGARDLYRKAASGAGEDQVLLESKFNKIADDWSPDGRFLLYATGTENAGQDLWLLPLKADGTPSGPPHPFLTTPFNEDHGRFSPDGHWIAYMSDESGKYEVYVRPFPIPAGGGGKWQVSTGGGSQPLWRRDGRELLFFSPDSKLMSADVSTGTTFKAATPKPLFSTAITGGPFGTSSQHWAIAPDGQRFLIEIEPETTDSAPMTVVVNWPAVLKK